MKKKLLEESQIRRMMKFANIGSLSDGFVGRLNEQEEMDAPEEGGEEMDMEMDLGGEDEMVPGGDEEAGDEVLDAVSDLVDSVKDFVRRASKDPAAADMISQEREGEEGAGGEEDMEGPMDDPMGDEPMEEAVYEGEDDDDVHEVMYEGEDDDDVHEGMYEEGLMEVEVVDDEKVDEEMMNEVARRVARRVRLLTERRNML